MVPDSEDLEPAWQDLAVGSLAVRQHQVVVHRHVVLATRLGTDKVSQGTAPQAGVVLGEVQSAPLSESFAASCFARWIYVTDEEAASRACLMVCVWEDRIKFLWRCEHGTPALGEPCSIP